ncbi:MAG TPA: DUF3352 domain-containing protein [Actinomycetes bacterium]|nr:DUF3352 domain-containing protein [Actinomycetes bacterium]
MTDLPRMRGDDGRDPGDPLDPAADVLSNGPADGSADEPQTVVLATQPGHSKRRSGMVAGIGALALALVAAGGVYAYTLLSGGGTQPEKYVPADAIGFVKVDLDPAAGQKVAALRFFRHFPGGSDVLKGDDIRETVFRLLQENDNNLAQLDFDKDIAPWLGDRLGVAFLPPSGGGEQPEVLGVLQIKDEDKAKSGLAKVFDGDGPAVVFTDGYALLAADEASVTAARDEAAKGNLGDKSAFQDDLEPLGDGVAAFWLDLAAMKDAFGSSLGAAAGRLPAARADLLDETFKGRMAGAVTFNASHADLTVRGIGTSAFGVPDAGSKPIGPWLSTVPADTLVALGISGLDQVVADAFTSFLGIVQSEPAVGRGVESGLDRLERQTGLRLPDDVETLLGQRTLITVVSDALSSDVPQGVAMRAETDTAAAQKVLAKLQALLERSDAPIRLTWRAEGSDLVVGFSEGDLSAVQSGPGIADAAVKEALPNLDSAQEALWIDLDRIAELVADRSPDAIDAGTMDVLSHIAGIGLTATITKDGSTTTIRVVAD